MTVAIQRVVLVGFMASGKTAVGEALARALGWAHIDLDAQIEREQGRTIAEIFQTDGEARFREMEAEATRQVISEDQVVISTGGGWITHHRISELTPGTAAVWLRVDAQEVLRRLATSGQLTARPLLSGGDPAEVVRRLLHERHPLYAEADLSVETGGRDIDDVAAEIATIMRGREPAPSRF